MASDPMNTPVPVGPGGDMTLINQDECEILDMTLAAIPTRGGDMSMEDDASCVGVYRRADVAGY